ncbi:hypothetical protein [Senegalia massiliensis]|nr:hypothetical protein [Senegalia massiliensis]
MKKVIKDHSIDSVIITCNPDNIVDILVTSSAYSKEEIQKYRYKWKV